MNKSKVKNLPPIDTGYRPQVLLLGNGLSRCMGSDSWKDIIEGFIEKYHCPFSYENINCQRSPRASTRLPLGS